MGWILLTIWGVMPERQRVKQPASLDSDADKPNDPALPPLRRPVLFYMTVTVAFGCLAAAILALIL